MDDDTLTALHWLVIISGSYRYLRAYDSDHVTQMHTGEDQQWAIENLRKLAKRANAVAGTLATWPVSVVPTARTEYYADRLTIILGDGFANVIAAGTGKIEPDP